MADSGRDDAVRLVELLGAISLATDLGTGQPYSHGLRTCVLAVALGRELGAADDAVADLAQVALLRFLGCTSDASETAAMAGGDEIAFMAAMAPVTMGSKANMAQRMVTTVGAGRSLGRRAVLVAGALAQPDGAARSLSTHCEVAARLAAQLGTRSTVQQALSHGHERWDGRGFPDGLAGDSIPFATRVAVVARDADLFWRIGPDVLADTVQARRGRAYDPAVVDACLRIGPQVLRDLDNSDAWQAMLAADSSGDTIPDAKIDVALGALAAFTDLKSRWTRGHSTRVSQLAAAAAAGLGMTPAQVVRLRRAGLVHDLGRVGVPSGIWDRPGSLGIAEWERVRLHPYLTERILTSCASLADLGRLAGAHHERLDGSGYHRSTSEMDLSELVLATADVVAAMGEERPHRPALSPSATADALRAEVNAGRLDGRACDALLAAAGQPRSTRHSRSWPAGLSDREVEVLVLIARGRTNKEVAANLHLSVKTVGRHVENVYAKIDVQSRAAAAVFAMEHRLLGH